MLADDDLAPPEHLDFAEEFWVPRVYSRVLSDALTASPASFHLRYNTHDNVTPCHRYMLSCLTRKQIAVTTGRRLGRLVDGPQH